MGDDLTICRAARVSYDADHRPGDEFTEGSDKKLIFYLYKNRHTSPFEQVEFQFEVQVPFFIARQWHRHRTWNYNEVSARYTELDMGWFVPQMTTIGIQSKHNKQVRDVQELRDDMTSDEKQQLLEHSMEFVADLDVHSKNAFTLYRKHLRRGVPRELARAFLPMNAYTRFYAKVDLHNLFHFLELRLHPHAQQEVQDYAKAMFTLIEPIVPMACDAFREFTLGR